MRAVKGAVTLVTLAALVAVLTVTGLLPGLAPRYYLFLPGDAFPVAPAITIPPEYKQDVGELRFTVVYQSEATLARALSEVAHPGVRVVPYEHVIPPGQTVEESNELARRMMRESQIAAAVVGLRHAGYEVSAAGDGARVVSVMPNTPASGVLAKGDVIVAVDGKPVQTLVDLQEAIRRKEPGDRLRLTLERDGQTVEVTVDTIPTPGEPSRPRVGVLIETVNYRTDLPFPIEVESGAVVGPSAGLMFALGIYDAVTPGQLGDGHVVAGTGTLDAEGRVGPIEGITQKVIGAERDGASVFLAPAENAAEARAAASTARVISVATFEEALAALQSLS